MHNIIESLIEQIDAKKTTGGYGTYFEIGFKFTKMFPNLTFCLLDFFPCESTGLSHLLLLGSRLIYPYRRPR